jgi:hypothetical protein
MVAMVFGNLHGGDRVSGAATESAAGELDWSRQKTGLVAVSKKRVELEGWWVGK